MGTAELKQAVIAAFTGEWRFLSNFYPCVVQLPEEELWEVAPISPTYPSVEHAYQAAKTLIPEMRYMIRLAPTPGQAKKLGRKAMLRPGWDEMKIGVMRDLLRQKFAPASLRNRLLSTGDAQLVEGNHWGDTFWGVCKGVGENHLGKLLMEVREELRNA